MGECVGLDWVGYFSILSDDEIRELATWLAAEFLSVGEFMEIVDRAYARTSSYGHGRSLSFVVCHGRPVAAAYARRKRHFAELSAALEDARMSGAMPGDVAPQDLLPLRWATWKPRRAEEVLATLAQARRRAG